MQNENAIFIDKKVFVKVFAEIRVKSVHKSVVELCPAQKRVAQKAVRQKTMRQVNRAVFISNLSQSGLSLIMYLPKNRNFLCL